MGCSASEASGRGAEVLSGCTDLTAGQHRPRGVQARHTPRRGWHWLRVSASRRRTSPPSGCGEWGARALERQDALAPAALLLRAIPQTRSPPPAVGDVAPSTRRSLHPTSPARWLPGIPGSQPPEVPAARGRPRGSQHPEVPASHVPGQVASRHPGSQPPEVPAARGGPGHSQHPDSPAPRGPGVPRRRGDFQGGGLDPARPPAPRGLSSAARGGGPGRPGPRLRCAPPAPLRPPLRAALPESRRLAAPAPPARYKATGGRGRPPSSSATMQQDASQRGFLPGFQHFATQAIHAGQEPEQWASRAVVPPVSLATTFKQGTPGEPGGFQYSRSGNPTRNCLEKAVAALDGAKYSLAFASGLAATMTITHLLKAGDQVICMDDVYGGTNRYFRRVAPEFGLKISFVDCTKTKSLEEAITPQTKLVWIETPTNPNLKMADIEACARVVHKHGDIIMVVDNTFMSAYFQRPLALGADICMYSATKYMNGHSDVVMGLVSVNSEDLHNRLRFLQNSIGAVPSPFDCYLCCRGLKTLQVRMEKHFKNGMAVARFLESDPRVEKVIYPGLPSHPQHELAKRQCTGCPGMVTFYIKGTLRHSEAFLKSLKLFTLAESLGGYESLAELPATMTHASVPEKDRASLGISDTLIRLSVGLEDEKDLLEDLDQALRAAYP